jgi:hypothetical protein
MMETMGEISEHAVPALRERLRHVYWVGGGSGAGKSTISRRLAARHGLRLHATDDVMADHARRSTPADSPLLSEFAAMDMDERCALCLTATGCSPSASPGKQSASGCAPSRSTPRSPRMNWLSEWRERWNFKAGRQNQSRLTCVSLVARVAGDVGAECVAGGCPH